MVSVKRPDQGVSSGETSKKQKTQQSDAEITDQDEGPKRLSLFDVIEKEDQIRESSPDDESDIDDYEEDVEGDEEKEQEEYNTVESEIRKRKCKPFQGELVYDSEARQSEYGITQKSASQPTSLVDTVSSTIWHSEGSELPPSAGTETEEAFTRPKTGPKLPTPKAISNIFQKKQLKKLTELLNDVQTQCPTALQDYKRAVQSRERKSDKLISFLLEQNKTLETKVESLKQQVTTAKQEKSENFKECVREISRWKSISFGAKEREDELESEILSLKSESVKYNSIAQELESSQTRLNFLELLTGVHCSDVEDGKNVLKFTIQQTGKVGSFCYKLIIDKRPSNGKSQDVVYQPQWQNPNSDDSKWEENVGRVKDALPDYLHSELSFPLNTLLMFYNKISVSLN